MTPLTVLQYLLGDREAILRLARSRWPLAIGAVLVLTASLARNYDGKYLPREGEALLHGLVISVGNSFLLFSIFYLLALAKRGGNARPPFGRGYLAFLGLFWLTSPMAWFYAVPYERLLSPVEAIGANLWTLAIVSVWRVGLMTRVLSVLWQTRPVPTFLLVAFYSDALVFAAAILMEAPVVDFMGGLQHSPEEDLLSGVQFATLAYSVLAAPVLLLAALIGLKWLWPKWIIAARVPDERPSRGLIALAVAALLAWVPALAITQPEQCNRFHAESLLRAGRVGDAFTFMAAKGRDAFPPVWDPPPRVGFMELVPDSAAIRASLVNYSARDWVSDLYFRKHWRLALRNRDGPPAPEVEQITRWYGHRTSITSEERACFTFHADHDPSLRPEDREEVRAILAKFLPRDESAFFAPPR